MLINKHLRQNTYVSKYKWQNDIRMITPSTVYRECFSRITVKDRAKYTLIYECYWQRNICYA